MPSFSVVLAFSFTILIWGDRYERVDGKEKDAFVRQHGVEAETDESYGSGSDALTSPKAQPKPPGQTCATLDPQDNRRKQFQEKQAATKAQTDDIKTRQATCRSVADQKTSAASALEEQAREAEERMLHMGWTSESGEADSEDTPTEIQDLNKRIMEAVQAAKGRVEDAAGDPSTPTGKFLRDNDVWTLIQKAALGLKDIESKDENAASEKESAAKQLKIAKNLDAEITKLERELRKAKEKCDAQAVKSFQKWEARKQQDPQELVARVEEEDRLNAIAAFQQSNHDEEISTRAAHALCQISCNTISNVQNQRECRTNFQALLTEPPILTKIKTQSEESIQFERLTCSWGDHGDYLTMMANHALLPKGKKCTDGYIPRAGAKSKAKSCDADRIQVNKDDKKTIPLNIRGSPDYPQISGATCELQQHSAISGGFCAMKVDIEGGARVSIDRMKFLVKEQGDIMTVGSDTRPFLVGTDALFFIGEDDFSDINSNGV